MTEPGKQLNGADDKLEQLEKAALRQRITEMQQRMAEFKQHKLAESLPERKSLTQLARDGIALQQQGVNTREICLRIGLSLWTFERIRDLVLLSERDDLTAADAVTVREALGQAEHAGKLSKHTARKIKPITDQIWGLKGHRLKSDKLRQDKFQSAINLVCTTCTAIVDVHIPNLSPEYAMKAEMMLQQAEKDLRLLRKRIREIHYG